MNKYMSGKRHIDSLMSINFETLGGCFWTQFDPSKQFHVFNYLTDIISKQFM